MKTILAFGACVTAALVSLADPAVSGVSVAARRAQAGVVDIAFTLEGAEKPVDIAFSAFEGTTALDIPATALSGDLYGVENGSRMITLDLQKTSYADRKGLAAFRVALEPIAARTYMILDLRDGGVSYSDAVIGAGDVWDDLYKTHCVVLRRCPAGSFTMGSPTGEPGRQSTPNNGYYDALQGGSYKDTRELQHLVKISQPFYVGVFEFTQRQLQHLYDDDRTRILTYTWCTNADHYATRPVDYVSYDMICGATRGAQFPASDDVDDTSLLGLLRARFADVRVDLPTEAQWEYACRAGTTTALYNGGSTFNDVMAIGCVNRSPVDKSNRNVDLSGGSAAVGSYTPNAWGIYDMIGNMFEWTRDWASLIVRRDYSVDPVNPDEEKYLWNYTPYSRSLRGGSYTANTTISETRSAARAQNRSNAQMERFGFRISAPVARATASAVPSPAAVPAVSDVKVVPRWPWAAKVDIYYMLAGAADVVDIRVAARTASGETLEVKSSDLEGEWHDVANGARRLTWDLSRTAYAARGKLEGVAFTLTPEMARTYMLCDLAAKTISYTNVVVGVDGRWDDFYKTNTLVLRRCPAGLFTAGSVVNETYRQKSPNTTAGSAEDTRELQREVKISRPYYIGVFEFTQAQDEILFGHEHRISWSQYTNEACSATRPLDSVTYNHIRGGNYPVSDAVASGSLLASLQSSFDVRFDLPTDAQWEHAFRAGTTTAFYNGGEPGGSKASYQALADEIAVYKRSTKSGKADDDTSGNAGPLAVGTKLPNAWGLYDMAGNVWEWTRDYAKLNGAVVSHEVDPAPPVAQAWNGGARSLRGGCFTDTEPANERSAARGQRDPATGSPTGVGFRLYAPISY